MHSCRVTDLLLLKPAAKCPDFTPNQEQNLLLGKDFQQGMLFSFLPPTENNGSNWGFACFGWTHILSTCITEFTKFIGASRSVKMLFNPLFTGFSVSCLYLFHRILLANIFSHILCFYIHSFEANVGFCWATLARICKNKLPEIFHY